MAVDDPYFTVAELRARDDALADTVAFPDAKLEEIRRLVEESLEDAAHVAFVPRVAVEAFTGKGTVLFARHNRVRAVRAATDDGTVVDVTEVRVVGNLRLHRPVGWPTGTANLRVTYEHGHDAPPARIKQAALTLAKVWALQGPIDERATQVPTGDGGAINLATPGLLGAEFGVPEVDQAVRAHHLPKPNPLGL